MTKDIIIGIDGGTSVIKSVAFTPEGQQIDLAAVPNQYQSNAAGAATQCMRQTWEKCVQTVKALGTKIPNLANRVAAIGVTGQGDGTWLIDDGGQPVGEGWTWLDSRSAPMVEQLRARAEDRLRFTITGTGLNSCQQGAQLAYMKQVMPELPALAHTAMHCKDWLYFQCTGERASDPSEACFTFGDFRSRQYDDRVIEFFGLEREKRLLPPIVDGVKTTHPLTASAAKECGLLAGTPVSLAYVDAICTGLAMGVYSKEQNIGCSVIGSTGIHMRPEKSIDLNLNQYRTGYTMLLPVDGMACAVQSNMSATLNIDWIVNLFSEAMADMGIEVGTRQILEQAERWLAQTTPGSLLYHPYISVAGERGPFVNSNANASFVGLTTEHRFADILRAVFDGLGLAARDCYQTMGNVPAEIRLTGGAARSATLRDIFGAVTQASIRTSMREEAGAAGAAMIALVAIRAFADMNDCAESWVTPFLGEPDTPDKDLFDIYDRLFDSYVKTRHALEPIWSELGR